VDQVIDQARKHMDTVWKQYVTSRSIHLTVQQLLPLTMVAVC